MHGFLRRQITVVVLSLAASCVFAQGRTTVDPNNVQRPPAPAAKGVGADDARLDKKITYDACGVRLHEVVSEIARVSGAPIFCGSSPEDWRVRDTPVTVAARDIPVRQLLDFLAYATQTTFTEVKTEKSTFYRVVRNAKLQKKFDDYQRAVDNFTKAEASWTLDLATRVRDIPVSNIKKPKGAGDDWEDRLATRIAISRLLSAMDSSIRNAVLSGQQLIFSPATAPAGLRQAVLDVLKSVDKACVNRAMASQGRSGVTMTTDPASSDDLQASRFSLQLNGVGISMNSAVRFSRGGGTYDARNSYDSTSDLANTVLANTDRSTLPKQPVYPPLPDIDPLAGATSAWNAPELSKKYAISVDAANGHRYGGDALIVFSKVSGLTIVCEDYESIHKERDVSQSFGREMSVQDILSAAINSVRWTPHTGSKALIGYNHNWMQESRNMLPGQLIDNLTTRANADGIELDDLTQLTAFSQEAIWAWIRGETFQNCQFNFIQSNVLPVWAFYNSLSPQEKDQARSADGLSLSRYDSKVVAGMLAGKIRSDSGSLYNFGDQPPRYDRLLEADVQPTLVYRLKWEEYDAAPQPTPDLADATDAAKVQSSKPMKIPPGFTRRRNYSVVIEGGDEAKKTSMTIEGPYRLPYFSPQRERDLSAAYRKQNQSKTRQTPNP